MKEDEDHDYSGHLCSQDSTLSIIPDNSILRYESSQEGSQQQYIYTSISLTLLDTEPFRIIEHNDMHGIVYRTLCIMYNNRYTMFLNFP